jgi:hypothetical protein
VCQDLLVRSTQSTGRSSLIAKQHVTEVTCLSISALLRCGVVYSNHPLNHAKAPSFFLHTSPQESDFSMMALEKNQLHWPNHTEKKIQYFWCVYQPAVFLLSCIAKIVDKILVQNISSSSQVHMNFSVLVEKPKDRIRPMPKEERRNITTLSLPEK